MTTHADAGLDRAPGSIVSARGRDWVVLPKKAGGLVVARPLDGDLEFVTALFPHEIQDASFPDPALAQDEIGDFSAAGLLRTALRVSAPAGPGPFRSLAALAVQPRQYQLVPLMMALKMPVTRLLIGDDVGVGKTVEAALIAKELLDEGAARGLTVLCSPALADQWQRELSEKFGIEAETVLPSTAARLQKGVDTADESIFDRYPVTIVSTDFIKQPERLQRFIDRCPDLLIVDEVHSSVGVGVGHQQRYKVLQELAADPNRHLILVSATPHSGDAGAFDKLTALLDPRLAPVKDGGLPRESREYTNLLAEHFVQRRRADIMRFHGQETPFPGDRKLRPAPYLLDQRYAQLITDILGYAREDVRGSDGSLRRRMSWWALLTLLRCVLSSPAAAVATLSTRAGVAAATTVQEADAIGRVAVLEITGEETSEGIDVVPGTLLPVEAPQEDSARSETEPLDPTLAAFAQRAQALADQGTEHDAKLRTLITEVTTSLADGYDPIVFCQFIPTARYVADRLAEELKQSIHVACVTGELPPEERRARIEALGALPGRHVLVATDCLSEGVNLQQHFGAVIHYDLSWNPTRHEQREGRVDRFGQRRKNVRAVTLFDQGTGIDGVVLDVLIRKYHDIARRTGVRVAIPDGGESVLKALSESLILRGQSSAEQLALDLGDDLELGAARDRTHQEWESAAARQAKTFTKHAQAGLRPDDVQAELDALKQDLGEPSDIVTFAREALGALGSAIRADSASAGFTAGTQALPLGLRHTLGVFDAADQELAAGADTVRIKRGGGRAKTLADPVLVFRPDLPVGPGEQALVRTDPAVRAIARYVLDSALDPTVREQDRPGRRLGVIRTTAVDTRTILFLARFRFRLTLPDRSQPAPRGTGGGRRPETLERVAEDARLLAWQPAEEEDGDPDGGMWLTDARAAQLLAARPDGNVLQGLRRSQVAWALEALNHLKPDLRQHGRSFAEQLRDAHMRVREASGQRNRERGAAVVRRIDVSSTGNPDILGVYVYLPVQPGGGAR
ncbi:helicase-related protein [Kitasatospora sp. NPDC057738]|uniref:helicase-related protein n=1 Tax=Kitasatospora sp. NPDC057738 TaxID=3346233 RepID=UPI0036744D8E